MYLLWLLNNLNTWRASAVLRTVGLSAFVSELCQSRSQWLLQRNLILICWNRQANPPGCRGPDNAAHPCSSTAVIQPDLHTPHPPSLGYTYRGMEVGLGCSGLKIPKAPRDTAGVLVLDIQLWSPSGAEVWQLACPAAPALDSDELGK